MVSLSSNITSRGWNLRPKDRRPYTLMSWQPETISGRIYCIHWVNGLLTFSGFFFFFFFSHSDSVDLLTRLYIRIASLAHLIRSSRRKREIGWPREFDNSTSTHGGGGNSIPLDAVPFDSNDGIDTPLSCLKPAGLLCPVVVKTIRWQSEYGWNQILNQNLEKRQFRNSGRKQKQIFPTGHLRTLETRDERGQQSKEKRWRWYRRQVVSTFLPFLHLSQKRKANPQGKIFHIKTGEIIWQYTFEAHTFERIIRKIYLKKTKWKVWAVNIPAVLM